ncbi:MAG: SusC/RagA family TonB-linked outer membrane protein [Bacteroidota bacterium]
MILSGRQPVQHVYYAARCIFIFFLAITLNPCINAQNDASLLSDSLGIILPPARVTDGYSSVDKTDIIGSVAVVTPSMLNAFPSDNLSSMLQGRASGVTVTGSGQPGEMPKVRIRGFSSFLDNDPLYIVDGIPSRDISFLNPADVESLSVLKDAGSASVYGSRASNGVIVITTKKGEKGLSVSYDMTMGVQSPGKGTRDDVLTAKEYADLQWLVYKNDGSSETHPIYGDSWNLAPSMPFWAANTDWYDEMTDHVGIMKHDLTLSGGTENAKFYAGFGAFHQNGIILYTHDTRYNARLNSDIKLLKGRIKTGENFNASFRDNLHVPNLSSQSPVNTGPYGSQSIIPVRWTGADYDGWGHHFTQGDWGGPAIAPRLGSEPNVVAELTRNKDDYYREIYLNGSVYLDFMIIKDLSFNSVAGGIWQKGSEMDYTYPQDETQSSYRETSLKEHTTFRSSWTWTNALRFNRQFGRHNINAISGWEATEYDIGSLSSFSHLSLDVPPYSVDESDTTEFTRTRMLSLFIKADYSYADRYTIGFSMRRDGCSRFGETNRYAYFPSFSAGWHLSNEPFMESLSWISDMKIRGSWGKTGNQYAISPRYSAYVFGADIGGSYYDLYGTFNSPATGYFPYQAGNNNIKWEESDITDIGIDAGLFSERIRIIFDWYLKKSDDLLYNPPVAGTAGQASPPFINIGSMKNTGIDIEVSYEDKWGDLGFSGTMIFTKYNNEITGISESVKYFYSGSSEIGSIVRNEEGQPLSSFYGYKVAGIFKNITDVDNSPDQADARPGFLKFENHDTLTNVYWLWVQERYIRKNFIDSRDKTYIGNPNPDFTYGLDLALSWKNFDVSGFFYGSQGNEIFNYNKWYTDFWSSYEGQKSKALLYDSWTVLKTDATVPMATNYSGFSTNTQVCSYYIEDGSYLRLKSLQLGYSFPAAQLTRIRTKSLRIYLQAVNLFTLTKYSGLDPEIGGSDLASGIDYGNYPNVKQFLFGINLAL